MAADQTEEMAARPTLLRLDRVLANLGYATRSTAAGLLRDGRVLVDGVEMRDAATKVDPQAVTLDGEPLDHPCGVLVALHKPAGLVCSHDESEGPLVYDLLPFRWTARTPVVTSAGRLDKDTSGILILTDDSPLVHRLTSPKHHVTKEYEAILDRPVPADAVEVFASGTLTLRNENRPCAPADLAVTGERTCTVTMTEGRYHQVRRMFSAIGAEVESLHRRVFGPWRLGVDGLDLAPGEWCDINPPQ